MTRPKIAMTKNPKPTAAINPSSPKTDADDDAAWSDRTAEKLQASRFVDAYPRHAMMTMSFTGQQFSGEKPEPSATLRALCDRMEQVRAGDLTLANDLLIAQAMTLDTVSTEMLRRAQLNYSGNFDVMSRYFQLAFKAQSSCRSTLEALIKLHQPREQTVRHVHVNEGGQAVIADQFHHHTGGLRNAETAVQPHEPYITADGGPALPSPNPAGDTVPVPCDQGPETVQASRRQKPRRSYG